MQMETQNQISQHCKLQKTDKTLSETLYKRCVAKKIKRPKLYGHAEFETAFKPLILVVAFLYFSGFSIFVRVANPSPFPFLKADMKSVLPRIHNRTEKVVVSDFPLHFGQSLNIFHM